MTRASTCACSPTTTTATTLWHHLLTSMLRMRRSIWACSKLCKEFGVEASAHRFRSGSAPKEKL